METSPSAARQIARERAAFAVGRDNVTDEDANEHRPQAERVSDAYIADPDVRAKLTQERARITGKPQ